MSALFILTKELADRLRKDDAGATTHFSGYFLVNVGSALIGYVDAVNVSDDQSAIGGQIPVHYAPDEFWVKYDPALVSGGPLGCMLTFTDGSRTMFINKVTIDRAAIEGDQTLQTVIAHELGHILADHNPELYLTDHKWQFIKRKRAQGDDPYEYVAEQLVSGDVIELEWQADEIAVELMGFDRDPIIKLYRELASDAGQHLAARLEFENRIAAHTKTGLHHCAPQRYRMKFIQCTPSAEPEQGE